jgi:transcriptional regulator with XRE-family HTH domain
MGQVRDNKLLKKIALRIKELRRLKNVSQEAVYFATDIHVARIEQASVNVSVSTLAKLCNYFGITLADFFKEI